MPATEVGICNKALIKLRVKRISSLTDGTEEADLCNELYDDTRDQVLEDFPWNFATARYTLAEDSETTSGWSYQYVLPSDCVKALSLYNPASAAAKITYNWNRDEWVSGAEIPFEIAANEAKNTRVLLTDQSDAVLIYTARITDPNLFSPQFVEALATCIASKLAVPLRGSAELEQRLTALYLHLGNLAKVRNAQEGIFVPEQRSGILDSRI